MEETSAPAGSTGAGAGAGAAAASHPSAEIGTAVTSKKLQKRTVGEGSYQ